MKKIIFSLLLASSILPGCLKTEDAYDYSGIRPIVIIPDHNWPGGFLRISDSILAPSGGDKILRLNARVSFGTALDHDVRVHFAANPALIAEYNTQWFSNYSLLPDSCYRLDSLELVIPAQSRDAYLPVIIYTDKVKQDMPYMLAFSLTSAVGEQAAATQKNKLFLLKKP